MYNTKQKQAILELLESNKDKLLSADEMLMILWASHMQVSRATLYRYLDALYESDEIKKFYTSDEKAVYQINHKHDDCNKHIHLICLDCGKLLHTNCTKVTDILSHIEDEHDFTVDLSKIVFYGICRECKAKDVSAKEINND